MRHALTTLPTYAVLENIYCTLFRVRRDTGTPLRTASITCSGIGALVSRANGISGVYSSPVHSHCTRAEWQNISCILFVRKNNGPNEQTHCPLVLNLVHAMLGNTYSIFLRVRTGTGSPRKMACIICSGIRTRAPELRTVLGKRARMPEAIW